MFLFCKKCKKESSFVRCSCEFCASHCEECGSPFQVTNAGSESIQYLIDEFSDETSEQAQQELDYLLYLAKCDHCKDGIYKPDSRYAGIPCAHLRANKNCDKCKGSGFIETKSTSGPESPEYFYDECSCCHNESLPSVGNKKIKAVFFDCDGVLFTGRVFVHLKDGEFLKERSLIDGQGITNLREKGYVIGFITGETSGFTEQVINKFNNIKGLDPVYLVTGVKGQCKVDAVQNIIDKHDIKWNEVAYMGDDLSDLDIINKVGYPACPLESENIIKSMCKFVSRRSGGNGAIRDFANHILCEGLK